MDTVLGQSFLSFPDSSWGDKSWVFVYCSSDSVNTIFGVLLDHSITEDSALAATDLSLATEISVGNNYAGDSPLHLIRRFDIYSSFIILGSSPDVSQIYSGKQQ